MIADFISKTKYVTATKSILGWAGGGGSGLFLSKYSKIIRLLLWVRQILDNCMKSDIFFNNSSVKIQT